MSDNRGQHDVSQKSEKTQGISLEDLLKEFRGMRRDFNDRLEAHSKEFTLRSDVQQQKLDHIENTVKNDIQEVNERLDRLEHIPFDPERTVIFPNIKPQFGRTDKEIIAEILQAVQVPCTIKNVLRMKASEGRSGLLKWELATLEEKIMVLRAKTEINNFAGSWIRSSKTHIERVQELNFRTLLQLIPGGENYMITGNGKIIEKSWDDERDDGPQSGGEENKPNNEGTMNSQTEQSNWNNSNWGRNASQGRASQRRRGHFGNTRCMDERSTFKAWTKNERPYWTYADDPGIT